MFITVLFFPNTPPIVAPIRAAAQTDCRDLFNAQGGFETPLPKIWKIWGFGNIWNRIFAGAAPKGAELLSLIGKLRAQGAAL